ncbi:MAG: hypothetical protein KAS32_13605 [Candidatus Peribacteraceae bacterium]|nr:hypothetical protein [Candidatus Peribacteraceae bacterium]
MIINTNVSVPKNPKCSLHNYDTKVTLIPESAWDRLFLMLGKSFIKTTGTMFNGITGETFPIYEYRVRA